MKRLMYLLALVSMMGVLIIGCKGNEENQVISKSEKTDLMIEEESKETHVKGIKVEEVEPVGKTSIEESAAEVELGGVETDNATAINNDREDYDYPDDPKEVLDQFFEAVMNQDIEKASKYVLYDDLEAPFPSLKEAIIDNKDILSIEMKEITDELPEEQTVDMKIFNVNINAQEGDYSDEYILKKLDNDWYVATQGIISKFQSVFEDDMIPDGMYGIYLKTIYQYYTGNEICVISIVNNSNEKIDIGFEDTGAIIYENEVGISYVPLKKSKMVDSYDKDIIWFVCEPFGGSIKSMIITDVMFGDQDSVTDLDVFTGEMIEK